MSRATAIISRVGNILRKVNPVSKKVYKRIVTRTGGDQLLGRPASVDYKDILLDPPPTYLRISKNIVGPSAVSELIDVGGLAAVGNDYQLTVTSESISADEFSNSDLLIVFKDLDDNEEVFRITDYEPIAFEGTVIIIAAYIQSIQRPKI